MYSGGVSFEGDEDAARSVLEEAVQCANIVRGMKTSLGSDRMVKSFDIPGGSQVYVIDLEHVRQIHIIPPSEEPETVPSMEKYTQEDPSVIGVPDYVSGAVMAAIIENEEVFLPGDDPNEEIQSHPMVRNVKITEHTAERIPLLMARHKMAIEENPIFAPISNPNGTVYSQHRGIRPGYYTGAMRAVIQVLLGVGIVRPETYEQRWIKQNEAKIGWIGKVDTKDEETGEVLETRGNGKGVKSAFGLFGAKEPHKVEVMYDYRHNRTHGITWAADGKPYIVEIGQRGVLVMPLEVDPVSTIETGMERYEQLFPELFDKSYFKQYGPGESMFKALGGFPTGNKPPMLPDQLDRYVRAGEVVKAIDESGMSDFYQKIPYSTSMGWAFHPSGREAHNTCYAYSNSGVKEGYHYAVNITIGATDDAAPSIEAQQVVGQLGLTGIDKRKALRMTQSQANSILAISDKDAAKESFDALTVSAPFTATASLRQQRKGFLYSPGKLIPSPGMSRTNIAGGNHTLGIPIYAGGGGGGMIPGASGQPQFKFAEPLLGCLLSFDFSPAPGYSGTGPNCDTPMFVCFRGSSLAVVSYSWRNEPSMPGKTEDTRQPCQFVGSWVNSTEFESERIHGHFHSTDQDWRELISGSGTNYTKTTGTFAGNTTFLQFDAFFSVCSTSYREYWHSSESEGVMLGSHSLGISVAQPLGDRSIYYMAKLRQKTGMRETASYTKPHISGTGSGRARGLIYEFVWHWVGCSETSDGGPIKCQLRDARQYQVPSCWEDEITVADTPYAPCPKGPFVLSKRFGDIPGSDSWSTITTPTRELAYEVKIFGDTVINSKVTKKMEVSGPDEAGAGGLVDFFSLDMSTWWWLPSPTKEGALAYLRANTSRFGSPLIGYEPQFDDNAEFDGNPEEMHVHLNACYVGYVR